MDYSKYQIDFSSQETIDYLRKEIIPEIYTNAQRIQIEKLSGLSNLIFKVSFSNKSNRRIEEFVIRPSDCPKDEIKLLHQLSKEKITEQPVAFFKNAIMIKWCQGNHLELSDQSSIETLVIDQIVNLHQQSLNALDKKKPMIFLHELMNY